MERRQHIQFRIVSPKLDPFTPVTCCSVHQVGRMSSERAVTATRAGGQGVWGSVNDDPAVPKVADGRTSSLWAARSDGTKKGKASFAFSHLRERIAK